ncbi:GPP34 family phosphoprotein [Luteococcus sp. Sow4_B9]|uniref:GPP34 family phosphoprotein n=1 Tax=Luteococcus sp. Sow4_B9 TaxID=3438792 RepID=UPI003F9B9712
MENTIAHDLMLLALKPSDGGRRQTASLSYAIPAVLLAELALGAALSLNGKQVTVSGQHDGQLPEALRRTLDAARQAGDRKPRVLVQKVRKGSDIGVLDDLVRAGQVRRSTRTVIGLFDSTKEIATNAHAVRQLADQTQHALRAGTTDQRTLVLAWGLRIARLEKQVLGDDYRQLRKQAERMCDAGALPDVVLEVLRGGLKAREAMESSASSTAVVASS